jgi:hypothetical protein
LRSADGSGELRLPSYDLFSSTEILSRMALEKMLAGLMSRRLDDLDLVAFLVDGVHFGESTCIVALGIGSDGTKHPLAVEEGSTENATLVTGLVTGLRDCGLDVTRSVLAVLDGSGALARAVKDVFGKPLIQRCQEHYVDLRIMPRSRSADNVRAVHGAWSTHELGIIRILERARHAYAPRKPDRVSAGHESDPQFSVPPPAGRSPAPAAAHAAARPSAHRHSPHDG